jgi:uncharacterized LabA/DUF88 family protein
MSLDKAQKELLEASRPYERVMIFIDGGYLRRLFIDLFGDDSINYTALSRDLLEWYKTWPLNPYRPNLIRIYYYDGIVDSKDEPELYKEQREYFDELEGQNQNLDVMLSEAVKIPEGKFRQKGVDILLAIDTLVMAHLDHYDSGLFVLGDRDFIPLIEAVKDAGKKTFGFTYIEKVSKELTRSFDFRLAFDQKAMQRWRIEKSTPH